MSAEPGNPCKPFACNIQACIQRNQFNQERCEHLVDQLYQCCQAFYAEHGKDVRCASCPTPAKLEEKIRLRSQ